MRLLRVLGGLVVVALLLVAGGGGFMVAQRPALALWVIDTVWSPPPHPGGDPLVVTVPPGSSAWEIGTLLAQRGLVADPRAFSVAASWLGVGGQLQAGEYRLSPGTTVTALVRSLQQGRDRLVRVAIPEGRRAEEVAEIIAATGVAGQDELLRLINQGTLPNLDTGRPPGSTLEGYLFPDTYLVPPDFGAAAFISLLGETFDRKVPPALRAQSSTHGLTFHQALVLASIVERETAVPEERALIAGVFLNRLQAGIPLAADPTIQYALALDPLQRRQSGWWKRELTLEDIAVTSPFNTYRTPGLPPAPICNPGLAAIEAVLHPQATDYLFFVARPDGTHAFAATFDEHQRNIARYQQ